MKKFMSIVLVLIAATQAFASETELKSEIEKLKQQNESILSQLKTLGEKPKSPMSDVVVGGYGEIIYNAYSNDSSRSQMDVRRFVLSVTKTFNERLSFNGEMEWEHAVTSASDPGEAAIEQAYINYQLAPDLNLKAGLFLMPFGILNESHEPPVFYGVERNEVETRIIPSTWREGGVSVAGTAAENFDWSAGLVTGFDVAKFDDASEPLGSIHQELAEAKARDLSVFATLNYKVPGLLLGAAVFTGNSTQGNADFNADSTLPDFAGIDGRLMLADVHARIQRNGWDLQALVAKGTNADADRINQVLLSYNTATAGNRPFVASEFYGWLVQAAFTFNLSGETTLSPFARIEEYDTQSVMPAGFAASDANRDHVFTGGVSLKPHAQVVVKTDYQNYNDDSTRNRFNLGLGYMF